MRKTALYSMLLTGFVLFGCSANNQPVNPTTNSNPNTNINTTNQAKIDEQQAKEIALKEAGGGQVTEFSYDMDDIRLIMILRFLMERLNMNMKLALLTEVS